LATVCNSFIEIFSLHGSTVENIVFEIFFSQNILNEKDTNGKRKDPTIHFMYHFSFCAKTIFSMKETK
jgi:hypothetical protein